MGVQSGDQTLRANAELRSVIKVRWQTRPVIEGESSFEEPKYGVKVVQRYICQIHGCE